MLFIQILLKGSHSDELKRIKCVIQFVVIMAYHLILENSFILNQQAKFSTTTPNGMAIFSSNNDHIKTFVLSGLSSLSVSLQKVGFPLFDTAHQSMSAYLGYNGVNTHDHIKTTVQDLSSPDSVDTSGNEVKASIDEPETLESDQLLSSSTLKNSNIERIDSEDSMQHKDDISAVLNSESILVLMSRRNVTRGLTCKQSSFSCIKFYRHFDVPLGKFLRDNLLNQVS